MTDRQFQKWLMNSDRMPIGCWLWFAVIVFGILYFFAKK
jgi:hypothetical protein